MSILFTFFIFISKIVGGFIGLKFKDKLHLLLGFSAGVLLGIIAFEIFPEINELVNETGTDFIFPMLAFACGFLLFHTLEKIFLIHSEHDNKYTEHNHLNVGIFAAIALTIHSFLDGVGIGIGFQVSIETGVLVALALVVHGFSDGVNTTSLMISKNNSVKKTVVFILINAVAPILGALSTLIFELSPIYLILYLGFFSGFILYIAAAEILPEAHSKKSSYFTVVMTLVGVLAMFAITFLG